jgi:glycosyltransferase involved in cell wall biosynthesis
MRLAERGGYTFVPLLPPNTLQGKLHRLVQRAARKFMPWSKWTFGLMPLVLRREAERVRPDLAIAHSEPALFAALALHRRGVKVGVDMEDWFSEDLPPESRRHRPVNLLRRAERDLLRCAVHATCTTEVMADALARAYECPRPTRIYNVFPKPLLPQPLPLRDRSPASKNLDNTTSRGRAVRSIHWFSQTIGPGRGLEDLFAAAESLPDDFEIHLRGNRGGYGRWIESAIPATLRGKVFLHEPVPNEELPERIAEHDIGFAGEVTTIRSRDLTATNKIFQYLQSGLAVVASDTAGQREVASLAGDGVRLFRANDAEDLATKLGELTGNAALRRENRESARLAAQELCWEKEQQRLLKLVHFEGY